MDKKNLLCNRGNVDNMRVEGDNFSLAFINLAISVKYSGHFALIPSSLNLDKHIEEYPITDYNFVEIGGKVYSKNDKGYIGASYDKDRMLYMLDLLNIIPANKKDSITENGYVSINSKILRKYFKDYLCYLNYLIDTGVIISDNHYEVGIASKGYKLSPIYENSELVITYYSNFNVRKVLPIQEKVYDSYSDNFQLNNLTNYPYLAHWYNQKRLIIDDKEAVKYAHLLMKRKFDLGYNSWDVNRSKWSKKRNDFSKKNPKTQYNALIHNVKSTKIHDYKAKIDTKVHRLHSVLTNIQKEYRNFITYNGQALISIDITNSQPYLLNILFNPNFWNPNSNTSISINNIPNNIQSFITPSLSSMIGNYLENLDEGNLSDYRLKTSKGMIYEHIRDLSNEIFDRSLERGDIKTMFYIVLFSKNKFFYQQGAELKRLFSELYPQIYDLIAILKSIDHTTLACLLQSIESEIVLHRCCKRIWEDGKQRIPVFTIHDSIVTTQENVNFVKRIMIEELTRAIGVSPKLDMEEWKKEKLKNQDVLTQVCNIEK